MKWIGVGLLLLLAHFAASYVVPLDAEGRRAFLGLLRWAWPWADGDHGLLGTTVAGGALPAGGFFIAAIAAACSLLAALAVGGLWVPFAWWRPLAAAGAAASLVLMAGFFGPTKVLPIAADLLVLWAAYVNAPWVTGR